MKNKAETTPAELPDWEYIAKLRAKERDDVIDELRAHKATLAQIWKAEGVASLSAVLATIRGAREQGKGEDAAIREERRLAAEAERLKAELAKLKASNGRSERRAALAANKADRRAEENAQLSRAMVELARIIGDARQDARDAWEAVAEERERADHQEARKEEQIAKLARTADERVEADERIEAWEQIVKHRAFVPCYEDGARLLPAMLRRLDQLLAGQGDQ